MDGFQITLWVLAAIGATTVVVLVIIVIAALFVRDEALKTIDSYEKEQKDFKDFQYLDNEVRGDIRESRGYDTTRNRWGDISEPTLKGRVDMIEQHLGIKVEVKPAEPAKLVVKKPKGGKK